MLGSLYIVLLICCKKSHEKIQYYALHYYKALCYLLVQYFFYFYVSHYLYINKNLKCQFTLQTKVMKHITIALLIREKGILLYKTLPILNISSYSDRNLFRDVNILRTRNYDCIKIINPPSSSCVQNFRALTQNLALQHKN